ncbi:N-6 DNA methylase [Streptomyces lonegramiae]|uniref:N-6 DNA methylase n=1 Tax=Streptomyces lonegramiae TaxID=3075524 RepID=A0ABU2XQL8_9ACTN|nr:N-6 DNA methylase [Streptomyces sp. DSM 41529]MDT0548224.1 N-6 DNA methylase [Streptomyces sp. DSM 41529]
MTSSRAVPVTLAEIARLAGVGRAAVSNWRRRHESFPGRIGGTDLSPQFSLAEIEAWLRDNNKLKNAAGREWLWPQFEALGSRDETGLAVAAAGRLMSGPGGKRKAAGSLGPADLPGLSDPARELVGKALELGRREGPAETFEFLLRRWLDVHVRQISTTPAPLAALMAELAIRLRARGRAVSDGSDGALTVLDPACGTGHLLAAASGNSPARLIGCDRDPVLAELANARLALLPSLTGAEPASHVEAADSLRADPFADTRADLVLCNPPFNERDWGYEELATDARWAHGMPPRTEPELAWVQHCLARLSPGGTAVVLLPPAVATRRAGRRIRGSLLRTGQLRAVVALPPGCAAPHSVSLHLWILRMPATGETAQGAGELLLADGVARFPRVSARDSVPDWEALGAFVRSAVDAVGQEGSAEDRASVSSEHALPECVAAVPVIDLLDDEVDLTPGRHITPRASSDGSRLSDSWSEFGKLVADIGDTGGRLAALALSDAETGTQPTTTVGELARAGALTLRGGQQPANGTVCEGQPADGGVSLLTVPDLLLGGEPHSWLSLADAEAAGAAVAEPGDVVVAGVARAFSAWVHQGRPLALGPQLYALRVHPDKLDAWFLAGSLRAPANARQAGTHASSSSRVDVRKLQVRQVPLAQQRQYSEAFQQVAAFERLLTRLNTLGGGLVHDLSDELAAGRLSGAV